MLEGPPVRSDAPTAASAAAISHSGGARQPGADDSSGSSSALSATLGPSSAMTSYGRRGDQEWRPLWYGHFNFSLDGRPPALPNLSPPSYVNRKGMLWQYAHADCFVDCCLIIDGHVFRCSYESIYKDFKAEFVTTRLS